MPHVFSDRGTITCSSDFFREYHEEENTLLVKMNHCSHVCRQCRATACDIAALSSWACYRSCRDDLPVALVVDVRGSYYTQNQGLLPDSIVNLYYTKVAVVRAFAASSYAAVAVAVCSVKAGVAQ